MQRVLQGALHKGSALIGALLCLLTVQAHADWSTDPARPMSIGTSNTSGSQRIVTTADGYSYIVYAKPGGTFYARFYDPYGKPVWDDEKVVLARNQSYWFDWGVAVDADGSLYLASGIGVNTGATTVITKLKRDGSNGWASPVLLSDPAKTYTITGGSTDLRISGDNVVVVWSQADPTTGYSEARTTVLHQDGSVSWTKTVSLPRGSVFISGLVVDDKTAGVAYEQQVGTSRYSYQYAVQSYKLADGTARWNSGALLPLTTSSTYAHSSTDNTNVRVASDYAGGILVGWRMPTGATTFAAVQHVRSDGSMVFPGEGLVLTVPTLPLNRTLAVASDGLRDYVVEVVSDGTEIPTSAVFAMCFDNTGQSLWGSKALTTPRRMVSSGGFLEFEYGYLVSTQDGIAVEYGEGTTTNTSQRFITRVNAAGSHIGTTAALNSTGQNATLGEFMISPFGELRTSWFDQNDGSVYVSNTRADDTPGPITTLTLEQLPPRYLDAASTAEFMLHYLDPAGSGTHTLTIAADAQLLTTSTGADTGSAIPLTLKTTDDYTGPLQYTTTLQGSAGATSTTKSTLLGPATVGYATITLAGAEGDENSEMTVQATVDWASPKGDLKYTWTQLDGNALALKADGASLTIDTPYIAADEAIGMQLEVTDGTHTARKQFKLTIHNTVSPSIAEIATVSAVGGQAFTIAPQVSGALQPLTWSWAQIEGPTVAYTYGDDGVLKATAPSAGGTIVLLVSAKDGNGEVVSRDVTVKVSAAPESAGGKHGGGALPLSWSVFALLLALLNPARRALITRRS